MWVCVPTDSLRLVSIYISFSSLSQPGFGKELNITGWPAVVLVWAGWAMSSALFSNRQISYTENCWFASHNCLQLATFTLLGDSFQPFGEHLPFAVLLRRISSAFRFLLLFFFPAAKTHPTVLFNIPALPFGLILPAVLAIFSEICQHIWDGSPAGPDLHSFLKCLPEGELKPGLKPSNHSQG